MGRSKIKLKTFEKVEFGFRVKGLGPGVNVDFALITPPPLH